MDEHRTAAAGATQAHWRQAAGPGSFYLFCENAFSPANWSRLPTVTSLCPTIAKAGKATSTAKALHELEASQLR